MPETIMPCFGDEQYPDEGRVIGRLLTGYGELELEMCVCVGIAIGDTDRAIKEFFQVRGEDRRIRKARVNLSKPTFNAPAIESLAQDILSDMDWCREIRNQYAHCQWGGKPSQIGFVNFEEVALVIGPIGNLESYKRDLDKSILEEQEQFFIYVRHSFWHLAEEIRNLAGGIPTHTFPKTVTMARPRKHI